MKKSIGRPWDAAALSKVSQLSKPLAAGAAFPEVLCELDEANLGSVSLVPLKFRKLPSGGRPSGVPSNTGLAVARVFKKKPDKNKAAAEMH